MDPEDVCISKKVLNFSEKAKDFFGTITVEPVVALFALSLISSSLAHQNLNLEKACRVNLGKEKGICDGMVERNTSKYNETDEIEVQKLVASMYVWKSLLQGFVPAFFLLFLGSWIDRHQQTKYCIIIPIFGCALSSIGYIVCTYFFYEIPIEYSILIEVIPLALTGSWFVLALGVYCYIGKHSSVESRTVRYGALSTLYNVCFTAGIAASGFLYVAIGYYGVFSLSLCMYTTAIIYHWLVIKEEPERSDVQNKIGFVKDFFDTKHVLDTLKILYKNKSKKKINRLRIIFILIAIVDGPTVGEHAVMYLFVRYRFKWSEIDFSVFSFYTSILHTAATIFTLSLFSKHLQVDDALIGVMSSISKILASFVYCFATSGIVFYLGSAIAVFNGTSYIALRSISSKLVAADELGKMNSLFGLCEAIMPLIYGPMYSLIYKLTITIMPGTFFLFGSVITLPGVIIFWWLYKEHKKDEYLNAIQREELLHRNE